MSIRRVRRVRRVRRLKLIISITTISPMMSSKAFKYHLTQRTGTKASKTWNRKFPTERTSTHKEAPNRKKKKDLEVAKNAKDTRI
jgi:hypothetical protein